MGNSESNPTDLSKVKDHLSLDAKRIQDIAHVLDVKARACKPAVGHADGCLDRLEQDKENLFLLKGLFKTLDPLMSRVPGEVHGQIQLSIKYEVKRQLLLVKVTQCRNLCSTDVRSRALAPYVKLEMHPDTHSHGIKTTQILVETSSPIFNEIIAFKVYSEELKDAHLTAQVWDYDSASQDNFLGEVVIKMASLSFEEEPVFTDWYDLHMETDLNVTGQLSLTLSFQLPNTLYVTVHGAQGLSPCSGKHTADPFIKVGIPGLASVFSSQVNKGTLDPDWEETFQFEITLEELSFRYIVFNILDQNSEQSENLSMGQAIVDLDVLGSQPNQHLCLKLADLKNSEKMQSKMMQRVITQEFREACLAHTHSRHPGFLFQSHRGQKLIRVSCRKAGRSSRITGQIRILDGIPVL